ncbi:hypothetical protein ATCC90586_008600 [Pythium insidiosum]|nr:hypothetical protein ATCC90586_008600 [Pythium insidiosum]
MAGKRGKKVAVAAAATSQQQQKQTQKKEEEQMPVAETQTEKAAARVMIDDGSDDEIQELKVNEKFAKSYLERKRKEELTRLEKYGGQSDDDESDSETEDEDGEELTPALDADIKKTLELIRKRDPIIYEQGVSFFKPRDDDGGDSASDSEEEDGKLAASKGKAKDKNKKKQDAPVYYKDLVRQHVMAGDVGSDEDEDDEEPRVMTYQEEQQQLKKDILKSMQQAEKEVASDDENDENDEDGSDLEGGLFSIRKKTDAEEQADEKDFEQFKTKYGSKLKKDELDPEAFLENYLSSGGWKEKKNVIPHYEDIVKEDEEDAEELEKMEQFEHSYNFRYEEEGSSVIQTYSRQIEDSMRRKDDSRKRKREERKERKALERLKKEEELKRLKNLKQAEIQSKLEKIAKLMGKTNTEEERLQALSKDLEGEFDPDEYDRRMQQVFDEEYYNEEDAMEKPTWDEEEDKALFAGLPVDDEDEEEADEEAKDEDDVTEEADEEEPEEAEHDPAHDDDEDMEGDEEDADGDNDHDNEKQWEDLSPEELQRAKEKYLDELYGLDYEDLIGDIKCRFKYKQVAKNDFGLTAEEIMAADDKELKQLVSLKRLAPYREEEYAVNRRKIKQFKKSLQEKYEEEKELAKKNSRNKNKKKKQEDEKDVQPVEETQPSKKRKRNKKSKQATESTSEQQETETEAEPQVETDKDVSQSAPAKKKSRRGKKKSQPQNQFASTGLSSSRLESYKLLKAAKK